MVQIPTASDIARVNPRSGRIAPNGPSGGTGAALARFGQDMVQTAYNLNDLAVRQDQEELRKRGNDVSTNLTRFMADEEKRFNEARDKSSESGIGFTRQFMEGYQQRSNEFAKSNFEGLSPDDQTRYLNSLLSRGNALYEKANGYETKVKAAYYDRNTNQNLDVYRTQISNNAADFDALKAEGRRAIESADMPAPWKADRLAKWDSDAAESKWKWEYSQNPTQALEDINPVGSTASMLRKFEGFQKTAYYDTNAYRVGYGSDTVTHADGTVEKVTKNTVVTRADAERDLARRSKEFENAAIGQVGVDAWAKLPGNARAALTSVAYNYGSLPDSVAEAVKGGDVNSIADAVADLDANPKRRKEEAAIIRGTAAVPASDEYASISYDRREQLASWGETQYRQQQNQAAAQTKGAIEVAAANAPAAISNTGDYQGFLPTPEQFVQAYGVQDGPQKYAAFSADIDAARQSYRFQTMPESEIRATVAAATPTGSGDMAAAETARFDAMSKAADATIKAREADPSTYTMRAFPKVAEAWRAGQESGDYSNAMRLTAAAEQQIGITEPKLLPKEIATHAVDTFKNAGTDDERLAAISSLVFATNDPTQRRAVFDQLVDAGVPPMAQGVMEAMARGDEGAARRLMQAVVVDPGKLPSDVNVKPTDITSEIYSSVWAPGEIGDAAYGLSYGDAASLERAKNGTDLLKRAVTLRVAQGEDLETAVGNAKKDLFGDKTVYDGSFSINANLPVPANTDENVLTSGLEESKGNFRAALEARRERVLSGATPKGLLAKAEQQYPILKGKNVAFVSTPDAESNGNMLEAWPPGEPGTAEYPRPKDLPIDQYGIQVFSKDTKPSDVAADIVSHFLVKTDPKLKVEYQNFAETFNTPKGQARLRQDYEWSKENEGETRPLDQWAQQVRIPAYFRGYVFKQWPEKVYGEMYSPDQLAILEKMNAQIGQGGQSGFKASDGSAAILETTTQNRIDDILDNGVFVPVGNGVGLRDPYTGQFVTGEDGKPVSIPLDEILKRGTPAAESPAGSSAADPMQQRDRSLGAFLSGPNGDLPTDLGTMTAQKPAQASRDKPQASRRADMPTDRMDALDGFLAGPINPDQSQ